MLYREEKSRKILLPILILIFGGLVGTLFGKLIGVLIPEGALHDWVSEGVRLGLQPPATIDLWITSITFGLTFQFNICGLLLMIFILIIYKKA